MPAHKKGVSHGDSSAVHNATNSTLTTKRPAAWARRLTRRARVCCDTGQPALVREIIARRIIKAATKGERDPARSLRNAGLAALGYDREAI